MWSTHCCLLSLSQKFTFCPVCKYFAKPHVEICLNLFSEPRKYRTKCFWREEEEAEGWLVSFYLTKFCSIVYKTETIARKPQKIDLFIWNIFWTYTYLLPPKISCHLQSHICYRFCHSPGPATLFIINGIETDKNLFSQRNFLKVQTWV